MSSYDTELFGHWWFEGVLWLEKVLRHLASDPGIDLMTASEYVQAYPPASVLHIPESSWGAGGNHFTWNNTDTRWMWAPLHEAELRMEGLTIRYQEPTPEEEAVLKQIAREALLLQSSDWQFLVTTGQARDYAIQRFNQHLERFTKLADSLDRSHQIPRLRNSITNSINCSPISTIVGFVPVRNAESSGLRGIDRFALKALQLDSR